MSTDFWKKKKVLITGHTGFKGSWLALWLRMKGAHVVGYSLPAPTQPNLFEILHLADNMVSLHGDVRDLDALKKALVSHRPEIVIHMAAQALVRYAYTHPVETYSTNVMGTVNVLESCRQAGCVKVVLIITSDKCYENREWVWGYRENDPMGGYDPYSSSKGCVELVTAAYTSSYFSETNDRSNRLAVASARAGNVIGGGDWAKDRLLPDIIRAVLQKKKVQIRCPQAIRPWQHVMEPLSGYLSLVRALWSEGIQFSGGWNFGPPLESCKPVSFILEHVRRIWRDACQWEHVDSDKFHEATFLKLDCTKANSLLSWSPRLDIEKAIEMTLDWYKRYLNDENMIAFTEKQINHFETTER